MVYFVKSLYLLFNTVKIKTTLTDSSHGLKCKTLQNVQLHFAKFVQIFLQQFFANFSQIFRQIFVNFLQIDLEFGHEVPISFVNVFCLEEAVK